MAFEDPAEEELDYDNDDALDPAGLPGHPVLEEEDLDDDEDYEDLYGDVNVGMYAPAAGAAAAGTAPAPPPSASNAPNGDLEMESLNDDENGDLKDSESGEPALDYLPDDSAKASMMDAPPKLAAPPKLVVMKPGANGGDPGRGWPAGSGPAAGGQAVAINSSGGGGFPAKQQQHGGGGQGGAESGGLMLFVGELQWWTTDAELEAALSEYGRIKNLKFFEEKASGKSKGYCQVEFFDSAAARLCKDKMDGRVFNNRACVVAFASPQTIKQMGAAQVGKNQANAQGQAQATKKAADGRAQGGDGRGGFSKSGGRGQPAMERGGRGSNQAPGRGRGGRGPPGAMMPMGGPPGGMMPPRGMMPGGVFEPGFGPGYGMGPSGGGFGPRPMFGPPFPPMGPGLPGVPAHVNPAFFARGNGAGPGMGPGMEGPPGGWGDVGLPSWEEHQRHMREGGYAGPEDEFAYGGGGGGEMGRPGPARERERGAAGEGEWGPERRRRDERSGERGEEWDRSERHRGTSERDAYRERDKDKDWDRSERPASRAPRENDDERARSREDDHGKRRRITGERDRKADR